MYSGDPLIDACSTQWLNLDNPYITLNIHSSSQREHARFSFLAILNNGMHCSLFLSQLEIPPEKLHKPGAEALTRAGDTLAQQVALSLMSPGGAQALGEVGRRPSGHSPRLGAKRICVSKLRTGPLLLANHSQGER